MQVQKIQNKYELYSNRAPSVSDFKIRKFNKTKRILLYLSMTVLALALCAMVVFAVNTSFDNSVFSAEPTFTLKTPGYSSFNSVFSEFQPVFMISIKNRNDDKLIVSTDSVALSTVLDKQNIMLDESCVVNYSLDTVVFDGMEVVIDSITYEDVNVDSSIPYETKTVELRTIPRGSKRVVTKGVNGVETSTYRRKFINGVFDSEELVGTFTASKPVTEVVQLGVGGTIVGKDGNKYSYSYYIDVSATCYGKADGSGSVTATGTIAREGVVAVDPNVIKLGSKLYIKGSYKDLGVCYAEDTGGAIKGNKIDVYLDGTLEQLLQFGRRDMRVYILD